MGHALLMRPKEVGQSLYTRTPMQAAPRARTQLSVKCAHSTQCQVRAALHAPSQSACIKVQSRAPFITRGMSSTPYILPFFISRGMCDKKKEGDGHLHTCATCKLV
jgi:hypothetical protein